MEMPIAQAWHLQGKCTRLRVDASAQPCLDTGDGLLRLLELHGIEATREVPHILQTSRSRKELGHVLSLRIQQRIRVFDSLVAIDNVKP